MNVRNCYGKPPRFIMPVDEDYKLKDRKTERQENHLVLIDSIFLMEERTGRMRDEFDGTSIIRNEFHFSLYTLQYLAMFA